jgi:hypothetical protein
MGLPGKLCWLKAWYGEILELDTKKLEEGSLVFMLQGTMAAQDTDATSMWER